MTQVPTYARKFCTHTSKSTGTPCKGLPLTQRLTTSGLLSGCSTGLVKMAVTANEQTIGPRPVRADMPITPNTLVRKHDFPGIEETNELLQGRLTTKDASGTEAEQEDNLRDIFRISADDIGFVPEVKEDIREKTAPLRLLVWILSITIALFALPVGAALMVVNLLRGENLRLSSQAAALTGTFVAFQTFDTTALVNKVPKS